MSQNSWTSLDCNCSNFTQCDRCILSLLKPHLLKTVDHHLEESHIQQILNHVRQVLERGGVIGLTRDGELQFMTQRAEELLTQYVSSPGACALPDLLSHWFKHQISQLTLGKASSQFFPLHIEQADQQLMVCIVPDPDRKRYLLLLEERERPSFSVTALELLGLTKREAEVLFWIAQDSSNASIAKELGCSESTVRKHLEHIYDKLNVQTRTGAVMVALQKLGLLQEPFVAKS